MSLRCCSSRCAVIGGVCDKVVAHRATKGSGGNEVSRVGNCTYNVTDRPPPKAIDVFPPAAPKLFTTLSFLLENDYGGKTRRHIITCYGVAASKCPARGASRIPAAAPTWAMQSSMLAALPCGSAPSRAADERDDNCPGSLVRWELTLPSQRR